MNRTLTRSGTHATVYTKLGQVLRVPLRQGTAPERQFISWFNRQSAANPGFPMRVKTILLVTPKQLCGTCRAVLLRFLNRYHLANRVRLVATQTTAACACRRQGSAVNELEQLLAQVGLTSSEAAAPTQSAEATQLYELSQELSELTQEYESWFSKMRNTVSKYSRIAKLLVELAKGTQPNQDHVRAAEERAKQQMAEQVEQNRVNQQRDAQTRNRKPPGAR